MSIQSKVTNVATQATSAVKKNPQGAINLALLAGGGFLLYKGYQNLFGDSKQDKIREAQDQQILNIPVNTSKLSRSKEALQRISRNIFDAMDGYGTDEDTIIENLEGLNKNDLQYIIKDFGFRLYNGAGESTTWIDKNLFSAKKDLIGWLKAELKGSDEDKVKQIFTNAGIPF